MTCTLQSAVGTALRDTVPFLAITAVWTVVMLVLYGLFLFTKPAGAAYGTVAHVSVFVPPLVGFSGHALREALREA